MQSPPNDSLSPALVKAVEALKQRFAAEWGRGEKPRIEDYLPAIAVPAQPALLAALVSFELRQLAGGNEALPTDSYRGRFSDMGPWVDSVLTDAFAVEGVARVELTVLAGANRGATYAYEEHDTFLVGRAPDASFSLPRDPFFSRMHFLIEVNPPRCRLIDLRSTNGTQVNGKRVESVELRDGDRIKAGETEIGVRLFTPPPDVGVPVGDTRVIAEAPAFAPTESRPSPVSGIAVLPGYAIEYEIGRGGMGAVYKAKKIDDGLCVAIKTFLPSQRPTPTAVAKFRRESDILAKLSHPRVVRFREIGEANGVIFCVMEYVEGMDAGKLVQREKPLAIGRAVRLACDLLDALAHAHAQGFVHRDVKPPNLLVTHREGAEIGMLADFGLARAFEASQLSGLTMADDVGGTILFMPPEQVTRFREVRPAADQYSAAATLYWLLTGEPVVKVGEGYGDQFLAILSGPRVPIRDRRADIPVGLADAIHKALAMKPDERYIDVKAFAGAIRPYATHDE